MSLFDWIISLFRRKPTTPPPDTGGGNGGASTHVLLDELHRLHNAERSRLALPPLVPSAQLDAAAQRHATWMASSQRLDHNGDGSPFDRIKASGYRASSAAENIAMGYTTPAQVMSGWMNSTGHRRNITGYYQNVGYGVADAENRRWWCVVFASPVGMMSHDIEYFVESPTGLQGPYVLQQ